MLAGIAIVTLLFAAPPSPEAIGQAQRSVLSDESYQTTWPQEIRARRVRPREPDPTPGGRGREGRQWQPAERRWTGPAPEGGRGVRPREVPRATPPRDRSGSGDSSVLHFILWLAAIAALALLILAFVRAWRRTPKDVVHKQRPQAPPPQAPAAALARPLTEAERLAAEGRFADAIHVLLLETLAALRGHTGGGVPESLTSREVLREVSMPDAAREAMGGLVAAVERSLFGNRPVDQIEYQRCTESFSAFRHAYESATA